MLPVKIFWTKTFKKISDQERFDRKSQERSCQDMSGDERSGFWSGNYKFSNVMFIFNSQFIGSVTNFLGFQLDYKRS